VFLLEASRDIGIVHPFPFFFLAPLRLQVPLCGQGNLATDQTFQRLSFLTFLKKWVFRVFIAPTQTVCLSPISIFVGKLVFPPPSASLFSAAQLIFLMFADSARHNRTLCHSSCFAAPEFPCS